MNSFEEHRRVQLFLNVLPWMCKCGAKNFGRNLKCPACGQLRPADYKKKG